MKSIIYLLTILFLSLLISCSEEPPTGVDSETLSKKPKPPEPTQSLPPLAQGTNYIAGSVGGDRRNDPKVFIWNGNDLSREWTGSIEAFTINGIGLGDFIDDGDKELLVVRRIKTGKGSLSRNQKLVRDNVDMYFMVFRVDTEFPEEISITHT